MLSILLLSWLLWSGRQSSWLAWGTHSPVYNHHCNTWGLRPPHATDCGQLGEGQGSILVCIVFPFDSCNPVNIPWCKWCCVSFFVLSSSSSHPNLHSSSPFLFFNSLMQLMNMKSWCWRRTSVASRQGLSRLTKTVPAIGSRTRDQLLKRTSKQLRAPKQLGTPNIGSHMSDAVFPQVHWFHWELQRSFWSKRGVWR